MSDNKEFGLTTGGAGDIQKVAIELKDHSHDPVLLPENPSERTELEKEVDAEIIAKGAAAVDDFDASESITVTPKKRGRPAKKEIVPVAFPCKSCGEMITDRNIMKIGAGKDRFAAFCPFCQRSLGFIDEAFQTKVTDLVKNNPTGKDEKKASA